MSTTPTHNPVRGKSWYEFFKYKEERDLPNDVRNALLVVVILIASVTFQAGVNPPGGVWQDNEAGHYEGTAVYATRTDPFYVFLIFNSVAFSTAILVIMSLTYGFPFYLEVLVATASMVVTYASAIFEVTPHQYVHFRYILIAAATPFVVRLLKRMLDKRRSMTSKPEAITANSSND